MAGGLDRIFRQKCVSATTVGLPIKYTMCSPTEVDRAIKAGGEGIGIFSAVRAQQLCPGFSTISAVFGQECVKAAAVGLPIECTIVRPTDIDRAIKAGGEGTGNCRAARAQQLGPGFGAIRAVFG